MLLRHTARCYNDTYAPYSLSSFLESVTRKINKMTEPTIGTKEIKSQNPLFPESCKRRTVAHTLEHKIRIWHKISNTSTIANKDF